LVLMSSVYSLAAARSRAIDLSREHSHWRGRESRVRIGGVLCSPAYGLVLGQRIYHAFSIFASTSILPVQFSLNPCTVHVLVKLAPNQNVDPAGMLRCIPNDKLSSTNRETLGRCPTALCYIRMCLFSRPNFNHNETERYPINPLNSSTLHRSI
jgi:hypothetical protein